MKFSNPHSHPDQKKKHLLAYSQEYRWIFLYSVALILFTSLPYLIGWISQGDDWHFTGFLFGVEDGNSYIAKMRRGSAGDWLFRTPFSAHPQNGILAYLPYLLLGKLPFIISPHDQLVVLYHLFRMVAGIFSIWATYDFLSLFLERVRLKRLGLVISTVGGGLGWTLLLLGKQDLFGSLPIEYYSPESFGFLALFGLPHLSMARALLLWGLCCYLNSGSIFFPHRNIDKHIILDEKWRGPIIAFILLLLGFFQPLIVIIAWIVIAAHLLSISIVYVWRSKIHRGERRPLIEFKYFRHGFLSVLLSSPIVIYTMYSFMTDSFLRSWMSQNILLAPHPVHYLLAYGLLIPFAIFGAKKILKYKPIQGWLPVAWVLIFPFLAYIPHNTQRRWVEGVWIALIVLALSFYDRDKMSIFIRPFNILLLVLPSTLIIWFGSFLAARQSSEPLFRRTNEVTLFEFVAENSGPEDVVLASYQSGNALPAWAPVHVVIGHGPESVGINVDSNELRSLVKNFYQVDTSDLFRIELLRDYGVDFVYWGPHERALGDWDPQDANYLQLVNQSGEYAVFSVEKVELNY